MDPHWLTQRADWLANWRPLDGDIVPLRPIRRYRAAASESRSPRKPEHYRLTVAIWWWQWARVVNMAAVGAALCKENCHDDRNHDLALPGFWVDSRGIRLSAPYRQPWRVPQPDIGVCCSDSTPVDTLGGFFYLYQGYCNSNDIKLSLKVFGL